MRTTLAFAGGLLKPHARWLAAAAVAAVLFRLLPLQVPILAGALVDGLNGRGARIWGWSLQAGAPESTVRTVGLILALVAVSTGVAVYFARRFSSRLEQKTHEHLRDRVILAWQHSSLKFQREQGPYRFSTDILGRSDAAGRLATSSLVEGLAAATRLLYPAAMLLVLDPRLAAIPLAALPLQAFLTRYAQRRESRLSDAVQEASAIRKRAVREAIAGTETIQALNAQAAVNERLGAVREHCDDVRERAGALSRALTAAAWGLAALGVALSWWVGGSQVAAGKGTIGHLVAFTGFAAFLGLPLRRFTAMARRTQRSLRDLERIQRFLNGADADARRRGSVELVSPGGAIELRGVSYRLSGAQVLQEASALAPAGEFVWLRGPSGCGKSSLLGLIAGLDLPDKGSILLGGRDLAECTADSVRRAVTLVPQQPVVFSGTLESNLRLAAPEASVDELESACAMAGLGAMLDGLELRLETAVGEHGIRLSAGEAQRLAIARALLRRPRVLLLDEPTAPLDEEAELRLLESLGSLTPAMTIVMAAHQVRSLSRIDRVLELSGGQILEWPTAGKPEPAERREHECPSA